MAKRRASERLSANSKSAGINLRRARSPDAPKITIVQGSATATELCGSRVALLAISLVEDASGVRRVTPTIQPRCRFYRTDESLPTPSLQASWSGLPILFSSCQQLFDQSECWRNISGNLGRNNISISIFSLIHFNPATGSRSPLPMWSTKNVDNCISF